MFSYDFFMLENLYANRSKGQKSRENKNKR